MNPLQRNARRQSSLTVMTLSDQFEGFMDVNPTVGQLSEIYDLINQQCTLRFRRDAYSDPTVSSGTMIRLVLHLSTRLLQWVGPDSDVFRETQLRALIAALALLHHSGVQRLAAETYDDLRRNIAGRFSDITVATKTSLENRIRKANALYLIRLAAQYFSLIKREGPITEALALPVLGLVLAGVSAAGGQYQNLREVFRYADEVIGLIPGRESQYLNLPAVQEITRRATTSLRRIATTCVDSQEQGVVEAVMDDVGLLQELLRSHFRDIPSRRSDSWNWPLAKLRLGPPSMNKWYFFYGLLDCLAQLVHHLPVGQMSVRLLNELSHLLEESEFKEFRWKSIEIFLSYAPTRTQQKGWLRSLERASRHDPSQVSAELGAVTAILEKNSTAAGAAAIQSPHLGESDSNWGNQHEPHDLTPIETQASTDQVSSSAPSTERRASAFSDTIEPYPHTTTTTPVDTISEADIARYMERDVDCWQQAGEAQVSKLLPPRGRFRKGFAHAGLSHDCDTSFFHNGTKVSVYPLVARDRGQSHSSPILKRKFDSNNLIVDVSLSESTLAVSTRQALELYRLESPSASPLRSSHGEWDPSGLAIHEQLSEILIAVGHRRGMMKFREGRVTLYRLKHGEARVDTLASVKLPMQDFPRTLMFDSQGERLTCITEIRSSVLVWHTTDMDPFVISRYHHQPETGCNGVTSAVIYKAPSQHSYVLCSTSASTERFHSGGEWSFCSPVGSPGEQVPKSSVQDFTTLTDCRRLVAGAVSSRANVYTVLEASGEVFILRLTGHEEGGICAREEKPQRAGASLCSLRSSTASTTCMRFDPSGEKLYAVDPEGTLLVVTFRPEH